MCDGITPEVIEKHGLSADEYQRILSLLGREPNYVELGIFSVMWSEHCSYKSSRKFLKMFPTSGSHVIQGPGENAGVIDIGDHQALVFKMESHNHPSFIEPYQGAATGVGGILRDVFTMGARPIANLNSLRFGAVDHPKTAHLVDGVVSGIAGYGNCMGVPTVAGEVVFDDCYNGNILVNAMTVGIVDHDKIFKGYATGPGNPVIYVGAKTGRDGIHGATMASGSFDESSASKRPTVQVGDPFTEKRLLEACLELMAQDVIVGIQDMGAAGLTSSSFEMASRAGTGIEINLDCVPCREQGMVPYEMMLSESQERMLMVCQQGREQEVMRVFAKWDLDAAVIGQVTNTGRYVASFQGHEVINLPVAPLADAAPVYDRPRQPPSDLSSIQQLDLGSVEQPTDLLGVLEKLLSHPNGASKRWVYRQYDHQVMTNTVLLPGHDAAVIRIKETSKAVALTTDCNSRHVFLDPYEGSIAVIAEAGRNLVCTGAKPLAVTDCLNFGNPERPEIMWQFERAIAGLSHALNHFEVPVVSGNVSFYNETQSDSIYPTPTIGMVGLVEDVARIIPSQFQREGDGIFLLGVLPHELGGSFYLKTIHGLTKGRPESVDLQAELRLWNLMMELRDTGWLRSAHDLSDGGLAMALAESCFGRVRLGADIAITVGSRSDAALFGEGPSRILLSVDPAHGEALQGRAAQKCVPCFPLGRVTRSIFQIRNQLNGECLIKTEVGPLYQLWDQGFEKGVFGSACVA